MRMSAICSAIGLSLLASCQTRPAVAVVPTTANAFEPEVRAVVQRYLYGLKFNQVDSLRGAFWPEAKLLFVKRDGSLGQLTQAQWYEGFTASAGKEEEGELGVVSVDITGDAASVKVLETYPKSVYVDYLNLLRVGGQWRIVNKIYTSHGR